MCCCSATTPLPLPLLDLIVAAAAAPAGTLKLLSDIIFETLCVPDLHALCLPEPGVST
jgi:hypothetical protein